MSTLIKNVHLATMVGDQGLGEFRNSSVFIQDGRISSIGCEEPADEVIDGRGGWLLPGLIDCHTHLVWGGSRAEEFERRLQGESYESIAKAGGGIVSTVRATREAPEEELFELASARLASFISEGVSTIEVKSGYGLDLTTELKMLRVARRLGDSFPVRVRTTLLAAHAVPPEYAGRTDEYIDFVCKEIIPSAVGLADAVDAFCERIAFSNRQTRQVFEAARQFGLPVKLHADQLSDSDGAALVAEFGGLSADHVEYTSATGVQAMAVAGTVAVLLPGAFYTLRESQLPPIQAFRDAGVPMAVSTDCNPGTSPCTSLLSILNMACTLFRLTPTEALRGVTVNAAKALGLQSEVGQIAPGFTAEFSLWNVEHPRDLCYRWGWNPLVQRILR